MPAGELAGGLGAIGLFAAPGYALTELFPPLRRLPWPRRAAYGYLLGVVTIAETLFFLSHAFEVPLRPPAVWGTAAVPALAGLAAAWWRRRAGEAMAPPRQRRAPGGPMRRLSGWVRGLGGPTQAACVAAAALVCAGLLAEAASNPVHDWDGRMTWSAQARYIRDEGTVDASVLRNPKWYVSHPQYPLLLPVAQVAALEAFDAGPDSYLQRGIYAAFFAALLLVIYDGARRAAGRTAAALVVLAAAAVPFFSYGEGGAFSTYSDLPLACFYGAAGVLLLGACPTPAGGLAAGLLLGGAALSKNEGPLLACLALALGWRIGAVLPGRRRTVRSGRGHFGGGDRLEGGDARGDRPGGPRPRRRAVLRFFAAAVPLALALALLASWRAGVPNRQDEDYPELIKKVQLWPDVFTHAAVFGPVLLQQMSRFHHWAGFWWMVPAMLIAGRRTLRHPLHRRRLLAVAGPPAIGLAAYSIHWSPGLLSAVTWERFLLQGCVPLLIVLAGAIDEVRRHFLRRSHAGDPSRHPNHLPLTSDEGAGGRSSG